ncbi:unnamed protein product [Ixodes pacificus]
MIQGHGPVAGVGVVGTVLHHARPLETVVERVREDRGVV